MTLRQIRDWAEAELKAAGIEGYKREIRFIISEYTGLSSADIILRPEEGLTAEAEKRIISAVEMRCSGEPLQYILGWWEFYGAKIEVCPGVLIPRPETELLAELAVKRAESIKNAKLLDLCCGSGCIAISTAKHVQAEIYASDLHDIPIKMTKRNAELNGVSLNIIKADALKSPPKELGTDFDIIVSNPPYIPADDIVSLQQEVKHEPASALNGGKDGLCFYRSICENYRDILKIGGTLAFEVGINQAGSVCDIMKSNGFEDIFRISDYGGIDRVVCGTLMSLKS